jgi:hypothetical protein
MESIQVGYVGVEGIPYTYHKYLIYTNSNNQQFIIEVIPQAAKENGGQLPEEFKDPLVGIQTELGIGDNPYGTMTVIGLNDVYGPGIHCQLTVILAISGKPSPLGTIFPVCGGS